MRKRALRLLGGFLVLGGILMMIVAGKVTESSKPNKVTTGYYTNGQYVITNEGEMGGNAKAEKDMDSLKIFGGITVVLGGVLFVISSFKNEEE